MRIAVITNLVAPYRRRAFGILAQMARENGGNLDIICTHHHESGRAWPIMTGAFRQTILPGIRLSLGENRAIAFNTGLPAMIAQCRPDILVLGGFGPACWQAHRIAQRRGIPTVILFDGWAGSDAHYENRLRHIMRRQMIAHARSCIATGRAGQAWFENFGKPRDHIHIAPLPPGFDLQTTDRLAPLPFPFPSSSSSSSSSPSPSPSPDPRPFDLLWCGRPSAAKGFGRFLEIAARLHRQSAITRIAVIGGVDCDIETPGNMRNAHDPIAAQIHDAGLSAITTRLPEMPPGRLPEFYRQAKLFLLPSRGDAYGVTVIEAIAHHTVVLASDQVGCATDMLEPAQILRGDDLDGWIARCRILLENPQLRADIAARQFPRIANNTPAHHARTFWQTCLAAITATSDKQPPRTAFQEQVPGLGQEQEQEQEQEQDQAPAKTCTPPSIPPSPYTSASASASAAPPAPSAPAILPRAGSELPVWMIGRVDQFRILAAHLATRNRLARWDSFWRHCAPAHHRNALLWRDSRRVDGHLSSIAGRHLLPDLLGRAARRLALPAHNLYSDLPLSWLAACHMPDHARILHGQGNYSLPAMIRARRAGMVIIADITGQLAPVRARQLDREFADHGRKYREISQFLAQRRLREAHFADAVFAPSQAVAAGLVECGIEPGKIHLVPFSSPGCATALSRPRRVPGPATGAGNNGIAPIRLLYVGNLSIAKGIRSLLAAYARIRTEFGGRVSLSLIGNAGIGAGDYLASLPDGCVWQGGLGHDRVIEHMLSSDIFVFPTLSEGSSLAVLEAMAAGCAIITTFDAGSPIVDGKTGLLVAPRNSDALTAALRRLINDHAYRGQLGQAARQYMQNDLAQGYGNRVEDAYDRVLARHG